MADALFEPLLRATALASAAIVLVLLLRVPMRRAFGAEIAYRLWLAPVLVFAASLLPTPYSLETDAYPMRVSADLAHPLMTVWALGAGVTLILLAFAQAAFLLKARSGVAGPAVVGAICPRIVMPSDDGRYSALERRVMRAHERMHIQRRDPQARAWMAFARCIGWWNPLVHLGVSLATLDQELACDAAVLRSAPAIRPHYARTLLRTQACGAALPFGARWAAAGRHPLETRLASLKEFRRGEGLGGPVVLIALVLALAFGAWKAQPPTRTSLLRQQLIASAAQNEAPMSVVLVTWSPGR